MSWKGVTLKDSTQQCPPLHFKQVADSSWVLPTTAPSDDDTTCPTGQVTLPSDLGEEVHVFIFDTGFDAFHPDLMAAVYNPDMDVNFTPVQVNTDPDDEESDTIVISDDGHYNAVSHSHT